MTNVEIANKIHELAMELADTAKMKGKNRPPFNWRMGGD